MILPDVYRLGAGGKAFDIANHVRFSRQWKTCIFCILAVCRGGDRSEQRRVGGGDVTAPAMMKASYCVIVTMESDVSIRQT